jgi:type VI protein secretion system component Hcp
MAGFDVFLKLDGIDGESTIKGHEKEIELVSLALFRLAHRFGVSKK